jgi:hypothetical protein
MIAFKAGSSNTSYAINFCLHDYTRLAEEPPPRPQARALPSVFRRQQNGVVGEVELDLVERKIRELDVLRIDDVVVAVIADEACGPVFIHLQFPYLEFFGGNVLLETLCNRNGIEKPVGAAFIGNVFGADRKPSALTKNEPLMLV